MGFKVEVKDQPAQVVSFQALPLGAFFRSIGDPRTVIYQKINKCDYTVVAHPIKTLGGPWAMNSSAQEHTSCIEVHGVIRVHN